MTDKDNPLTIVSFNFPSHGPGNISSIVPANESSVGKGMTRHEVLNFIKNQPEASYFIRWDYENSQHKLIEILVSGEKLDV